MREQTTECQTTRNDKTGPQASTPGSGIGAVARSRHLPSGCARLARVQASKIHIGTVQLYCLPRQLASLWEERTREGRASNSASIRVLVLLQEALLCSPRHDPQSSVEARAAATDTRGCCLHTLMPSGFDTAQASEQ